jgi:hypothetical protein
MSVAATWTWRLTQSIPLADELSSQREVMCKTLKLLSFILLSLGICMSLTISNTGFLLWNEWFSTLEMLNVQRNLWKFNWFVKGEHFKYSQASNVHAIMTAHTSVFSMQQDILLFLEMNVSDLEMRSVKVYSFHKLSSIPNGKHGARHSRFPLWLCLSRAYICLFLSPV